MTDKSATPKSTKLLGNPSPDNADHAPDFAARRGFYGEPATPRTDDFLGSWEGGWAADKTPDDYQYAYPLSWLKQVIAFVRQLERELAVAKQELQLLMLDRDSWAEQCKQAEQRLAEAEKDAERYRWLRQDARAFSVEEWPNEAWDSPETFDADVDAAIAQEKE